MTAPFIPLTPGCAPGKMSALPTAPEPDPSMPSHPGFQPFAQTPMASAPPPPGNQAGSPKPDQHGHSRPSVALERDAEGQVTCIRVQCPCGHLIELECVY